MPKIANYHCQNSDTKMIFLNPFAIVGDNTDNGGKLIYLISSTVK